MKPLITLLSILFLNASPAIATSLGDCTTFSDFAETVMRVRQDNRDMAKVLKAISHYPDDSRNWMDRVIIEAYKEPLYSSTKYKQRAIMKYKNKVFVGCYK